MCAGTKVDTVFGGRCEWCDETGQRRGLTPLPNGPLAMLPAMLDAVNHGVGVMLITAHKGAEHVPLQAFRRDVPRYKGMNVGLDSDCVLASDYDAAQSELAALREELERRVADWQALNHEFDNVDKRLADAERRNAELVELLRETCGHYSVLTGIILTLSREDQLTSEPMRKSAYAACDHGEKINAALNKPEEAKS
jgi:hypothetical protein